MPDDEFSHFSSVYGNGQSRLLQSVKNALLLTYPYTNIKGDGQVVVVKFSDGMKFEILPAFRNNTEEFIDEIFDVDIRYALDIDCNVTQDGWRPLL